MSGDIYRWVGMMMLLGLWACDAEDTTARVTCGSGTTLSADATRCLRVVVDDVTRPQCGPGTVLDEASRTCVGPAGDFECGRGTVLSANGRGCVLADPDPTCGAGTALAADGLRCVPAPGTDPVACGLGTARLADDSCALEHQAYFDAGRPLTDADRLFQFRDIAMTADGVLLFLRDGDGGGVIRMDLVSGTRLPDIPTSPGARSIAIEPVSGDLFIGNYYGQIDRISATTGLRSTVLRLGVPAEDIGVHEGLLRITPPQSIDVVFFDVETYAEVGRMRQNGIGDTETMIAIEGEGLLLWAQRSSTYSLRRAHISPEGMTLEPDERVALTHGPLRRLPGQRLVIGGDGAVINFDDSTIAGSIGLGFADAVITDDHIFLISGAGSSTVTVLTHDFEQVYQREQLGRAHRIFAAGDRVYAVSVERYTVINIEAVVLP
jgi:hypothetical protein